MSSIEDLEPDSEPLDEAGSLLLQLVAAVDYLRRGIRPGFTVWDAFEEALRWHADRDEDWTVADPLGRAIRLSLPTGGPGAAETLSMALRRWVESASLMHNGSTRWELRRLPTTSQSVGPTNAVSSVPVRLTDRCGHGK